MFLSKKPPAQSSPAHEVRVKLASVEITAQGLGLIVAPILLAMVLIAMCLATTGVGQLASATIGLFRPHATAATPDKPPPQA